jgi:hypothetical protein
MVIPARTTPTIRVPIDPTRRTALVGGTFYLITFIASIPALFLLAPVLDNPDYIVSSGSDTRVILGCFLDLVNALGCIGSAVALFSVVRRQHEGFALGFVTSRVMEAAIIVIGVVSLLAVVTLRQAHEGAPGADTVSLVTTGESLVAIRDWTFLLGPALMAGINALLLGTLMYRSGLVPRVIPLMGLIGAPLLITATLATLFGITEQGSTVSAIATIPIFCWELSLGLWLVIKGFKACPITTAMRAERTPPAYLDTLA